MAKHSGQPVPQAPPTTDPAAIKNLLLLWLVMTTQPNSDGYVSLETLKGTSAAANRAREVLGTKLRIDSDVVKSFVDSATSDPSVETKVKSVQSLFHLSVQNVIAKAYEGPFCPLLVDPIVELLPANAPQVSRTKRSKPVTSVTLSEYRRLQKAALAKLRPPAKKAAPRKTSPKK